MAKTMAITPAQVVAQKKKDFPTVVLQVFNRLIAEKFCDGSATVYQDEVVAILEAKGLKSRDIYEKGWLNVEDIYKKAGWLVKYDKPGYNETYNAYFVFSTKRC